MSITLSSISFPEKSVTEILDILKSNCLNYIEWCDCHISPYDYTLAENTALLCKNNGIQAVQYRSSFDILACGDLSKDFMPIIKTAEILGSESICLRAGNINSEDADEEYIAGFIEKLEELSSLLQKENKCVTFEFDKNTLFDNYMTTLSLLLELDFPNVFINWKPNDSVSLLYSLFELKTLIKYVKNVRINVKNPSGTYCALIENKDDWRQYINILRQKEHCIILNSSQNEDELLGDINTLRDILKIYEKN